MSLRLPRSSTSSPDAQARSSSFIFHWTFAAAAVAALVTLMIQGGVSELAHFAALGAAAGVLGLAVAYLALLHDPYPGQSRCPKCEYRLPPPPIATAALCPECGYVPKSTREVQCRPKRWGLAAFGVTLILCAPAGFFTQRALRDGFWRSWPAWAIISVLPVASLDAWEEIEGRLIDPSRDLSAREKAMLAKRCARTLEHSRDIGLRLMALDIVLHAMPEADAAVAAFRTATRDHESVLATWAMSHCDASWSGRELASIINDASLDTWRRVEAIWAAQQTKVRDPLVLEAILKALTDPDPPVREAASSALEDLQQAFFLSDDEWNERMNPAPLAATDGDGGEGAGGGSLSRPAFLIQTERSAH